MGVIGQRHEALAVPHPLQHQLRQLVAAAGPAPGGLRHAEHLRKAAQRVAQQHEEGGEVRRFQRGLELEGAAVVKADLVAVVILRQPVVIVVPGEEEPVHPLREAGVHPLQRLPRGLLRQIVLLHDPEQRPALCGGMDGLRVAAPVVHHVGELAGGGGVVEHIGQQLQCQRQIVAQRGGVVAHLPGGGDGRGRHHDFRVLDEAGGVQQEGPEVPGRLQPRVLQRRVHRRGVGKEALPVRRHVRQRLLIGGIGRADAPGADGLVHSQQEAPVGAGRDHAAKFRRRLPRAVPGGVHLQLARQRVQHQRAAPAEHALPGATAPRLHLVVRAHPVVQQQGDALLPAEQQQMIVRHAGAHLAVSRREDQLRRRRAHGIGDFPPLIHGRQEDQVLEQLHLAGGHAAAGGDAEPPSAVAEPGVAGEDVRGDAEVGPAAREHILQTEVDEIVLRGRRRAAAVGHRGEALSSEAAKLQLVGHGGGAVGIREAVASRGVKQADVPTEDRRAAAGPVRDKLRSGGEAGPIRPAAHERAQRALLLRRTAVLRLQIADPAGAAFVQIKPACAAHRDQADGRQRGEKLRKPGQKRGVRRRALLRRGVHHGVKSAELRCGQRLRLRRQRRDAVAPRFTFRRDQFSKRRFRGDDSNAHTIALPMIAFVYQ